MSYERFLEKYPLPSCFRQPAPKSLDRRNRVRVWIVILAFVGSLFAIAGLAHGSTAPPRPLDAVVMVKTSQGGGSGVVISPDGRVLTAEHVIGLDQVQSVVYRGVTYPAKALHNPEKNGQDEAFLLEFEKKGPVSYLPVATTPPRKGDVVYSFGYPWLQYYAANIGQVDEIRPNGEIRVDFWVIEGNSGGPLLNANGEVIGLCSSRDALPGTPVPNIKPGSTWIGLGSIQAAVSGKQSAQPKVPVQHGELLYFSTKWCGPCQRMKPIIDRLKKEGQPVKKIDADEKSALAKQYGIKSVPAFVLVVDGKETDREIGPTSELRLRQMLAAIPPDDLPGDLRFSPPEPYQRTPAKIEDLFQGEATPNPKIELKVEPFPEPEPQTEIDWSLVKIVVLRSNPDLGNDAGAVIAALQDRLGGPFRRRLLELTKGRADIELVHQQASPTKFAAVQAALGREAGKLLVVVLVKQQDLGLIKGQIVTQVQASLAGYIDGKVPVEVVSERVHPGDFVAIEAALETPEPSEITDNRPWWIGGVSAVVAFIVGYVTNLIRRRKAKGE